MTYNQNIFTVCIKSKYLFLSILFPIGILFFQSNSLEQNPVDKIHHMRGKGTQLKCSPGKQKYILIALQIYYSNSAFTDFFQQRYITETAEINNCERNMGGTKKTHPKTIFY